MSRQRPGTMIPDTTHAAPSPRRSREMGQERSDRTKHLPSTSHDAGTHVVRSGLRVSLATLLLITMLPFVAAQELVQPSQPNEQFIPADQLEAVFERDRRGVMMKRAEFKLLLEKARANSATQSIPIPIIAEQARLVVTPGEQQATIRMELRVRQYAEGWQTLRLRAGNLTVEKVEIDGQAAMIARDPAEPASLILAHEKAGEFTVIATMSTQLATLGSDRSAAFQLPEVPAVQLAVSCPAGRHLLVNDRKLDRPASDEAEATYVVPVGNAADVRLRWVVQQQETEAQTLVFVRTDAQLRVQKETLRWESDSRISVFGGSINRLVARVPSQLEITSIESTGLETWTLEDDPDNPGHTRVALTWRQPFTNDRLIRIHAVAGTSIFTAGNDTDHQGVQKIPTLQFAEVTAHTGRLVVTHEDGLRLISETGGGIRPVSAADHGLSTEASVFDFWMQQFDLQVAAKPRDRELFAESSGILTIDDTTAMFQARLTVETLNAPLFELLVTLPPDWQLTNVATFETSGMRSHVVGGVTWSQGSEPGQILIKPARAVAPGDLFPVVLDLTRTIIDPDTEQKLALPVVTAADVTTVGGTYRVLFADDLIVAPTQLTGLTPVAGSGSEQVFENLGTTIAGELSIVRKPARLAARSVLKTWVDRRQQSLDAEIIADVLTGTIRTLVIRLSESLGPDVRFQVRSAGPVPGMPQTRAIQPVTIVEQSAGAVADGLRSFTLRLDHRFAGSLSLRASVQQPRTDGDIIAAPVIQLQNAVRQHGVLVFEASPEQQLSAGPEVLSIPGLFAADAGLVEAPSAAAGRRVALTYRFVQPGYAFQVKETRFVTNAVPSAVCETLANVCTLNDSGSIQRWCEARIRSSGVQTLRFTLPGGETQSFLWSTMLNGEPVEVRRDAGDYLVAVPPNSDSQDNVLTVLFESELRQAGVFGQTDQGPVSFSMDAGEQQAIPIDVLKQTWRVHYPPSSQLVDSDGQFRPASGVDQPGWLVSLGKIAWPDVSNLPSRLIPLTIFMLMLFVLTVMVVRRRWKSLAALILFGMLLILFALPATYVARTSMQRVSSMASNYDGVPASEPASAPSSGMMADFDAGLVMPMSDDFSMGEAMVQSSPSDQSHMPGAGGMQGLGGAGAVPASPAEMSSEGRFGRPGMPVQADGAAVADPFQEAPAPDAEPQAPPILPQVEGDIFAVDPPDNVTEEKAGSGAGGFSKPRKGSARLSVSVSLDVPDDYLTRDFVSVADAVHQPSVLSLVIQRRDQIAAIRFLAAMIVILLAWRMRRAAALWKLTVAVALLLLALGLLPLVSNAWQSVVDGVAIGCVISVGMTIVMGCCSYCVCPLTWFRKWTANF